MSQAPTNTTSEATAVDIDGAIDTILSAVDQEREREIITRRFGLYDRKETLEQIGELLGITRERVRQLEKAILIRLKIAGEEGKIPAIQTLEKTFVRELSEMGRLSTVADLTSALLGDKATPLARARVQFAATLAPRLTVVDDNDNSNAAIGISDYGD